MYNGRMEYIAPPVLMAVCLKEYTLAKELVEAGYGTTFIGINGSVASVHGVCEVRIRDVNQYEEWLGCTEYYFCSLSRMIMGNPDMPDDIRLFLWEKIKEEKKLYWNQQEQSGTILDLDWSDKRTKVDGIVGFGEGILPENKQLMHDVQVMRTLELLRANKPEDLKEFLRIELLVLIDRPNLPFTRDLFLFLCQYVAQTDQQKIDLLYVYKALVKDGRDLGYAGGTFYYHWVSLYEELEPYYRSPILKEGFFGCLIREVLKICDNVCRRKEYLSTEEKYAESCFFDLLKKVQPANLSYKELDDYVFRFRLEEDICSSYILEEYWENVMANQIISTKPQLQYLCSGLGIAEDETVWQWNTDKTPCHLSEEERKGIAQQVIERWLNSVSRFSFNEEKPLDDRQWVMLYCKDSRLLSMACSKGLFRGKHLLLATEFCLEHEEYREFIPCIYSYKDAFEENKVEGKKRKG